MVEEKPREEHEVDAVTAEETASGMTDEQLRDASHAIKDNENLTDLEVAVVAETVRRKLEV